MTTTTATVETVARHVPANGTDIHFIEAGQGDPLILLHGGVVTTNPIWAGVPIAYTSYLSTLAEHFRIIAPDTRGAGKTARSGGSTSFDQLADDVVALIDALGLDRPLITGFSEGAITATILAIRSPGSVRAIVNHAGYDFFNPQSPSYAMLRRKLAAANWLFMPYVVGVLLGTGVFLTCGCGFVQVRRSAGCAARHRPPQRPGAGGVLTPFQAFMTALGGVDWHRQHRRRGHGHHLRRPGRAVLDLGLRIPRDGHQVHRGGARREVPRSPRRPGCSRDRCTTCATACESPALAWIYALVAGVAALTTTPFTQPNSIAVACATACSACRPWIAGLVVAVLTWAGHHRRHQVDRPRRREALRRSRSASISPAA